MIGGAKENLKKIGLPEDYFTGTFFAADSNYHSAATMQQCQQEGLDAYIPDTKFRTRDPRFATQRRYQPKETNRFRVEEYHYRQETDQYVCPQGKILKLDCKRGVDAGTIYRRYFADEKDCAACTCRGRCIIDTKGRRKNLIIPVGTEGINLTKQMAAKIDTEQGRKLYAQRMAIVEPIFSNIRVQKRLDRFTLRGKVKVNIQWLLYCMVHNIEKILNYGFAYAP
jgi:hypothetical protein